MKINELTERLNEMGTVRNAYSIFWNGSEWEVYYSERGKKRGAKKFLDESEACEYFLKHFLKQVGRAEK